MCLLLWKIGLRKEKKKSKLSRILRMLLLGSFCLNQLKKSCCRKTKTISCLFTYFLSRSILVSHSRARRCFFSATCLSIEEEKKYSNQSILKSLTKINFIFQFFKIIRWKGSQWFNCVKIKFTLSLKHYWLIIRNSRWINRCTLYSLRTRCINKGI